MSFSLNTCSTEKCQFSCIELVYRQKKKTTPGFIQAWFLEQALCSSTTFCGWWRPGNSRDNVLQTGAWVSWDIPDPNVPFRSFSIFMSMDVFTAWPVNVILCTNGRFRFSRLSCWTTGRHIGILPPKDDCAVQFMERNFGRRFPAIQLLGAVAAVVWIHTTAFKNLPIFPPLPIQVRGQFCFRLVAAVFFRELLNTSDWRDEVAMLRNWRPRLANIFQFCWSVTEEDDQVFVFTGDSIPLLNWSRIRIRTLSFLGISETPVCRPAPTLEFHVKALEVS